MPPPWADKKGGKEEKRGERRVKKKGEKREKGTRKGKKKEKDRRGKGGNGVKE